MLTPLQTAAQTGNPVINISIFLVFVNIRFWFRKSFNFYSMFFRIIPKRCMNCFFCQ